MHWTFSALFLYQSSLLEWLVRFSFLGSRPCFHSAEICEVLHAFGKGKILPDLFVQNAGSVNSYGLGEGSFE